MCRDLTAEQIEKLLKTLRLRTVLDLALYAPIGYEDTSLSTSIEEGKEHVLRIEVISAQMQKGQFRARVKLTDFAIEAVAVFFRSSSYHRRTFVPRARLTVKGKLKRFGALWQIAQPKVITRPGVIIPKYKAPVSEEKMRTLMHCKLSQSALMSEGLTQEEAELVLSLHFPTRLQSIYEAGGFKPHVIQTLKLLEAYNHFRSFAKKKRTYPAIASLRGDLDSFVNRLPYPLSGAQKRVIEQIKADLSQSEKSARRLIVGDVGSGKTTVIMASATLAYPHTSILMAPTSLLAIQLYEEACAMMGEEVKIALLTQRVKKGSLKDAHLIIGTHALLYRDDLPQAVLVMVDEQHRFGANQRHLLEKLVSRGKKRPHYLQFSATPIPRTQAMVQSALIDVSLIDQTPFVKRIETRIITKADFRALYADIANTIDKGEQVLIVYPLVEPSDEIPYQSIEEASGFWQEKFEGVFVTHGKDAQKEEVLLRFRNEGKILIATTVIEVGISLPRLTRIVIVGAERLGLATLHQLRGRVGRHGQESICYLYTHYPSNERLEAFAKCLDGFEIAKLDLMFRQSGDILEGTIQSGVKFRWIDMANDEAIILTAQKRIAQVESI